MNQDFVAWVGQDTVSDRTQEHLGGSDRGVIMMRRKMLEQAEIVAAGGEPKAVVRDPAENDCIQLPIILRDRLIEGFSLAELADMPERIGVVLRPKEFVFQSGQPEAVRQAYRHAMGLDGQSER